MSTKKRRNGVRHYSGDLEFVRDFLWRILDDATASSDPSTIFDDPFWYREDEGMLSLNWDAYIEYQAVLEKLTRDLAPSGDLSQSLVGSTLQDAMFAVRDVPNRRKPDPSTRVKDALKTLRGITLRPSEPFECWIEIGGLDEKSLPTPFGRVRFVVYTEYQRHRLYRRVKSKSRVLLASRDQRLLGRCFGVVTCDARDIEAARVLAEREVRATVECLNIFYDLIPHNHSWLFLPGEQETTTTTTIVVGVQGNFARRSSIVGPVGGYTLIRLRRQKGISKAVTRINRLLQTRPRNEVEEILVTSVRWAGRATVARLREEAFLLYAIALECAVLPSTGEGELSHRLSQRVARLLSGSVDERLKNQKTVRTLYRIRSEIVHSGLYEVREGDLGLIGDITKRVIFKQLADSAVAGLTKTDELEHWYEQRMLEG